MNMKEFYFVVDGGFLWREFEMMLNNIFLLTTFFFIAHQDVVNEAAYAGKPKENRIFCGLLTIFIVSSSNQLKE